MPQSTEPVRRICYADDITVGFWSKNLGTRAKSQYLFDGDVPASMRKLAFDTSLKINIADSELLLVRSPKILGVYLDAFFSFCVQVANRVSKRNNGLKALAGTNWGQQKETLQITYKALGRSLANYAAPVWSTNASDSNIGKIQRAQNEAFRIITGLPTIDHLHSETEMLQVEDPSQT